MYYYVDYKMTTERFKRLESSRKPNWKERWGTDTDAKSYIR